MMTVCEVDTRQEDNWVPVEDNEALDVCPDVVNSVHGDCSKECKAAGWACSTADNISVLSEEVRLPTAVLGKLWCGKDEAKEPGGQRWSGVGR